MLKPKKILNHVYELGVYKELDYNLAEEMCKNILDGWEGGCTAVARYTDDSKMIVGRNMDFYISHKPAYIVKTEVPDFYKTYGITYSHNFGPNDEDVEKVGLDDAVYKMLPFLCSDVFNEEGLYIETNMRNGEYLKSGKTQYGCTGTNPLAKHRICSLILPRYLGENCANVKEAIALVKELDIYTPSVTGMDWNFCFMLADKSGDYGVLEIAQNKISWLQDAPAQANFYLTPAFQYNEEYGSGVGRYELVTRERDSVANEDDMYELIKKVSYSYIYKPDICPFDVRSEYIGNDKYLTYDVMMDDKNRKEVEKGIRELCDAHNKKSRAQQEDEMTSWESVFTEVINCTDRTWFIRFFEDEKRTIKLRFS
ncbi:MAG: linear amide C-N hydrolase [Lachnospiraceae bacterium]|nr:linear amide C-N hydrolase [Lachnospiraceae bacterium]